MSYLLLPLVRYCKPTQKTLILKNIINKTLGRLIILSVNFKKQITPLISLKWKNKIYKSICKLEFHFILFSLKYRIVDELQSVTVIIISPNNCWNCHHLPKKICSHFLWQYYVDLNFYKSEDHLHESTPSNCTSDPRSTAAHLLTMHLMMSWCRICASTEPLYLSEGFLPRPRSLVTSPPKHSTVGRMLKGGGSVDPDSK